LDLASAREAPERLLISCDDFESKEITSEPTCAPLLPPATGLMTMPIRIFTHLSLWPLCQNTLLATIAEKASAKAKSANH
jgi:hypothetical protein